jgi:hypothetical protein
MVILHLWLEECLEADMLVHYLLVQRQCQIYTCIANCVTNRTLR